MSFQPSAGLLDALAVAQRAGLIGSAPLTQHAQHGAAFVDALGAATFCDTAVLDLGSGGGLPGLVVAERCPEARVTLLEGKSQRAKFLKEAVEGLGLAPRVEVRLARAEEAGHLSELRGRFQIVTARGFGSPPVTAECAAPFLDLGGHLVVSEPPGAATRSSRWPADGCASLGLELVSVTSAGWSFAVLRQVEHCPPRFPRRIGIPAKRPLF